MSLYSQYRAPRVSAPAKPDTTVNAAELAAVSLTNLAGCGTGVKTALAVNIGTDGAPVAKGGALGTPSSGVLANCSGLPIAGISSLGTGVGTALGNALNAVSGLVGFSGSLGDATASSLSLSGNISSAAWTTNGLRFKGTPGTLTDTTSSGTVAEACTNKLVGNTIAASNATTFINYYSAYFSDPVAGTNVTLSNKYSVGGDSARFGNLATSANSINAVSGTDITLNIAGNQALKINSAGALSFWANNWTIGAGTSGQIACLLNSMFTLGSGAGTALGFVASSNPQSAADLIIRRAAAATAQLGTDHATSPTNQTLKAHNVTTGTGASLTISGGTGSVAKGYVVLDGGNRATYSASPSAETIRDILISHGLMAAS